MHNSIEVLGVVCAVIARVYTRKRADMPFRHIDRELSGEEAI